MGRLHLIIQIFGFALTAAWQGPPPPVIYNSNNNKCHSSHYCKERCVNQIPQVKGKIGKRHKYNYVGTTFLKNSARADSAPTNSVVDTVVPPCYYKNGDNQWKERIQLKELKIGQKIIGEKITNADLLDGRTGPKIFFECGVGRIDRTGKWQMVSGMLRVAKSYSKPKVVKKKIKRYTGKEVELYVSNIRLDEGRLEVCTSLEGLEDKKKKDKEKGDKIISISSLREGQEVVGTVVDVRPYGVMVNVGANRNGLLHIQKVADLYGRYINREDGLVEAGLEKGASLRLSVSSNQKKRLFLDFTQDTKDLAEKVGEEEKEARKATLELAREQEEEDRPRETSNQPPATNVKDDDDQYSNPYYDDEEAAWAAYNEDEYHERDDDEDRDIEDALGIGFY